MCNGYTERMLNSCGCQTVPDGVRFYARVSWPGPVSIMRRGRGAARCPSYSQNTHDEKDGTDTHIGSVLPERAL